MDLVWITGAGYSNGIGNAIALELEKNNFRVVRIDIAGDLKYEKLDLTKENEISSFFEKASEYPNHIVNCAGINISNDFLNYKIEDFDKVYAVNVRGMFLFTQNFIKCTLNNPGPKFIINIGSDSGNIPRTNSVVYGSSKAAVQMFTKSWARDYAKFGYRVIELQPSFVGGTNMDIYINNTAAKLQGKSVEEIIDYRLSKVPMGRPASPHEIAVFVPFLIKYGEYANGAQIRITGGVSI